MNRNTGLRILSVLVLIAAVAGIAFFAYQAGFAHGSPVTVQAPSGQTVPAPYPYPYYGMPFHRPWGFGFGCFGILIPLFLFFLAIHAFRVLFWGPRLGWRHHGPYGRGWNGDVSPMFEEWHKKAHGETPEEKKE
ncbi:MAG: hypothetical protein ACM3XO_00520 [Bacteroidota bacterium]